MIALKAMADLYAAVGEGKTQSKNFSIDCLRIEAAEVKSLLHGLMIFPDPRPISREDRGRRLGVHLFVPGLVDFVRG